MYNGLIVFTAGLPYLILLYKAANIRIRLLFVCLIEIWILCLMGVLVFLGVDVLINEMYVYNIFTWLSVIINLSLILFSWLYHKVKISKSAD
jgi:hypothetical protein